VDRRRAGRLLGRELRQQAALADAGFAAHQAERAATLVGSGQRARQRGELDAAPDEPASPAT
jgi:hypothetical protein